MPPTTDQVPQGYTRFTAKDGNVYDFKGEGLSRDEVTARYQKARTNQPKAQPVNDGSTISAQPKFMGGVAELAKQGPFKMDDSRGNAFENYTPEGRAAHPFMAKLGDVARGAKDWLKIAGGTAAILGGPEGGGPEAALAESRPLTMPEAPKMPASEPASFAGPKAETPPVRTTPFAQPEPTQRFAGPTTEPAKPSPFKTRPAVENIVNNAFKVEPPPKAPFGKPLRATMAPAESAPVTRPIGGRTPEEQFQHSFGPEEEHVKGQAKWDTGNEHGNFPKPPSEKLPEQNPFKQSYESEEARKAAHGGEYEKWKSLGRVDLRQALIDAGIDMKDKIVSDAKMLGPGAMSRREAIQALTERGVRPPSVQPSTAPR